MTLTLNIPEPLLRRLEASCTDLPRAVLESFAVESYRSGTLSSAEVGELLGHLSRWETENFLAAHEAWPAPTLDEVARDYSDR